MELITLTLTCTTWVIIIDNTCILKHLFRQGEYVKDVDKILIPTDPLLNLSVPLPLSERDLCGGVFESMEEYYQENDPTGEKFRRDCYAESYPHSLSFAKNAVSKVILDFLE